MCLDESILGMAIGSLWYSSNSNPNFLTIDPNLKILNLIRRILDLIWIYLKSKTFELKIRNIRELIYEV